MNDANVLTPEEIAFFENGGNVSPEIEATLTAGNATDPVEAITPVETVAPAETVAPINQPVDNGWQQAFAAEQQRRIEAEQAMKNVVDHWNQTQQKAVTPPPDEATDPLGALLHKVNTLEQISRQQQETIQGRIQQQELEQGYAQMRNNAQTLRNEFLKTHADFDNAYNHYRETRANDLLNIGVAQADLPKVLLQEEIALTQNAIRQGKNPAEILYATAKRYGFTNTVTAAKPKPSEQIATLKQGASAAKIPDNAQAATDINLANIKDMADDDLNKVVQSADLWAKLAGGRSSSIY